MLLAGVPIELLLLTMEPEKGALESSDLGRNGDVPAPARLSDLLGPGWFKPGPEWGPELPLSGTCPSFSFTSNQSLHPTVCRPGTPTGQLRACCLGTSPGGTDHCSLCKLNKADLPDLRAYCPLVYQLPHWQMANTHWIFTMFQALFKAFDLA